jgi:hypothetical protein
VSGQVQTRKVPERSLTDEASVILSGVGRRDSVGSLTVRGVRSEDRSASDPVILRVEATLDAELLMASRPGLRARAEEMLEGIFETAQELRRIHGEEFASLGEQPMRVHVDKYVLSYILNLERRMAKILFVEPVRQPDANRPASPE